MTKEDKEAALRLHRCCFTGHRPEKLQQTEPEVKRLLEDSIRQAIADGYVTFISGMARGVDIWAAQIVLQERAQNQNIHLITAVPYKGFESRWDERWQQEYRFILQASDLVRFICPAFSMESFHKRNEWMVDHCSRVIAVYNGKPGGTRNTIEYSKKKKVDCYLL